MTQYIGKDIYCDLIIPKKIDINMVKETANVIAFYHTQPSWPVHIVVTCKQHIPSLLELDESLSLEMLHVIKEISASVKDQQGACRVITNLGEYQDSKHLHFHIVSGKF